MIIGVCGLIGSGKDTIAEHLIKDHKFHKTSFADKLKEARQNLADNGGNNQMNFGQQKQDLKYHQDTCCKDLVQNVCVKGFLMAYG